MKLKDCCIEWDPMPNPFIRVTPLEGPDSPYAMFTTGGVFTKMEKMSAAELQAFVLAEAMTMILRDGLPPALVHQALLVVDEYRGSFPDDVPGVRDCARELPVQ